MTDTGLRSIYQALSNKGLTYHDWNTMLLHLYE